MENKKRILALGNQNVFPPIDGGKEGVYGALASLAKLCDVTYAFPVNRSVSLNGYADINVTPLQIPIDPKENILLKLVSTLKLKPYKFEKYGTKKIVSEVIRMTSGQEYNAIVCHQPHVFKIAYELKTAQKWPIPIILREHNIEYQLVESYAERLAMPKKQFGKFYAWLTKREEKKIWRLADRVAFLTESDIDTANQSIQTNKFVLIRDGVALPSNPGPKHVIQGAPLLILHNPKAVQNCENLKIFIKTILLPLKLANQISWSEITITGVNNKEIAVLTNTSEKTINELRINGVGFVEDIRPLLSSSLALISATFIGGGIRKKILEAMAAGLPVIATNIDLLSSNIFANGKNILEFNSPKELQTAIATLEADWNLRITIGRNGRNTVEKFCDWKVYGEAIDKLIGEHSVPDSSQ